MGAKNVPAERPKFEICLFGQKKHVCTNKKNLSGKRKKKLVFFDKKNTFAKTRIFVRERKKNTFAKTRLQKHVCKNKKISLPREKQADSPKDTPKQSNHS